MIAVGTSTAFSRSNGRKDIDGLERYKKWFFLVLCHNDIIDNYSCFIWRKILITLGSSQNILPLAKEYLYYIIFASTF